MSKTTRKLTAILFTDIVGFTALMRADEKKALNLLYYNRQLLKPIIKKHDGEILKEMGDGTLNSFPSAIEAVRCALEIQEMLDNYVPDGNNGDDLPHISAIKYETFLNWNEGRSDRETIDI